VDTFGVPTFQFEDKLMHDTKHEIYVQLAHHARRAGEMTIALEQANKIAGGTGNDRSLGVTLQAPKTSKHEFDKIKFFADARDLLPAIDETFNYQVSLVDEYLEALENESESEQMVRVLRQAFDENRYADIVDYLLTNRLVSYREF
jgi:hypothetical protein